MVNTDKMNKISITGRVKTRKPTTNDTKRVTIKEAFVRNYRTKNPVPIKIKGRTERIADNER